MKQLANPEYRAVLGAILTDTSVTIRPRTRAQFETILPKFFGFVDKPVDKVTYADVNAYLTHYKAEFQKVHGRRPKKGTMNYIKTAIRWLYTEAVRIELVPDTMVALRDRIVLDGSADVQAEITPKATLTYDEFQKLYNAAESFQKLWLRTAWETIARPTEVCSIKWEDIDLDGQVIRFPERKVGAQGYAAITKELVATLREWKTKQHAGDIKLHGRPLPPSQFVFSYYGGIKPVLATNLSRGLRNLAAAIKLGKKVTAHCFRGSGAVYYRRVLGWSVEDVQRQGGWSNSEVLVKSYFKDEAHERVRQLNERAMHRAPAGATETSTFAALANLVELGVLSKEEARAKLLGGNCEERSRVSVAGFF